MIPLEMCIYSTDSRGGFIAVTSAVIVAVILLTVTLSLSFTGFLARFDALNLEYKERSLSLAEACANTAIFQIASNPGFTAATPQTITIGSYTCAYTVGSVSGGVNTIKTKSSFPQTGVEQSVTNLLISIDNATLGVTSWDEVGTQAL